MKIDKLILDEADKMEVVAAKPDKTQKVIHSIKPHKGHTLFEINPLRGTCVEAKYERTDIKYQVGLVSGGISRKVIAKEGHIYVSALNRKNALTKFFKMAARQMQELNKK